MAHCIIPSQLVPSLFNYCTKYPFSPLSAKKILLFASGSEAHASHLWILSNPALILMQVPTTAARRRRGARAPPFLSVCIHPPHFVLSTAHQPAASSARSLLPTPAAAAELHGRPRGSCRAAWGSARRLLGARPAARRSRSRGATGVDLGTASWNAGGPDRGVQGSAPGDMWPLDTNHGGSGQQILCF